MSLDAQQESDLSRLEGEYIPSENDIKTDGSTPQPEVSTGQLCTGCLSLIFGAVAMRKGDHWALTEEEASMLGDSTGAVLDKYFPDMSLGPEVALLGAAAMIVMPRIEIDQKAAQEKQGGEDGDKS